MGGFSYFHQQRGVSMDGISLLEGKRILVVDDEPDVLEALKALLSICDVVTASSFKEAKILPSWILWGSTDMNS